jgi:hypothetical protein
MPLMIDIFLEGYFLIALFFTMENDFLDLVGDLLIFLPSSPSAYTRWTIYCSSILNALDAASILSNQI